MSAEAQRGRLDIRPASGFRVLGLVSPKAGRLVGRGSWIGLNYGLIIVLIVVPIASFLISSFWHVSGDKGNEIIRDASFINYARLFGDDIFIPILIKTLILALAVAAVTLVICYPVAYLLFTLRGRLKYMVTALFAIPLLMSYIIKIYSFRSIIGKRGFLNQLLMYFGVIDEPSTLFLFNIGAVAMTLAVLLIPFMILPIFVSLEKIPRALLEASHDLGATWWDTFRRVVFPLSVPGVVIGLSFTFILAVGDFVVPQMVGGRTGFTYGAIIYSQFGQAYNWPFGAALSAVLLIVVLSAIVLGGRLSQRRGGGLL